MTSDLEEFERAIASVPGVASASISVSGETGRNRLRIRLVPGEDPEAVSWAVAATLRERFGIALDPNDIKPRAATEPDEPDEDAGADPRPEPSATAADTDNGQMPVPGAEGAENDHDVLTAAGAARGATSNGTGGASSIGSTVDEVGDLRLVGTTGERPPRAVIRDLATQRGLEDVRVTAILAYEQRLAEGHASAVPTRRGRLRAIAEATLASLDRLVGGRLHAAVDRVTLVAGDLPSASVLVTLASEHGEETLLGAALVRDDDLERAVMRATLDAVNRRAEPFLAPDAGEPVSQVG